jgi:hypoxanthine phosphoribosyltransferase
VLIVEDIIDTGLTLNYLLRVLRARKPASLAVCTLLDKDIRRIVDLPIEYTGFAIPDRFVVGYGLDLEGVWRNLPYVATVHDEVWDR